ncbi:MAG: hypothetical protein S4CHLAM102_09260 [Chlamydiia bacterium]|nr:hypothetical protein [Chlamydiia bacterium]
MKVAVVGFGFGGSSVAYEFLRQLPDCQLDVFAVGDRASCAASGMCHPYHGRRGKLNENGLEAFDTTLKLFKEVQAEWGEPIFQQSGVLRIMAEGHPNQTQAIEGDLKAYDVQEKMGWWIPEGVVLFSKLYLKAIEGVLKKRGVNFVDQRIDSIDALGEYDRVVWALGSGVHHFEFSKKHQLRYRKGHALYVRLPEGVVGGKHAYVNGGHFVPTDEKGVYVVGSTYEKEDIWGPSSLERARSELRAMWIEKFPRFDELEILDVRSGVRVGIRSGYLPILEQLDEKNVAIYGFGSRGLLYAPYYAKQAVKMCLS